MKGYLGGVNIENGTIEFKHSQRQKYRTLQYKKELTHELLALSDQYVELKHTDGTITGVQKCDIAKIVPIHGIPIVSINS